MLRLETAARLWRPVSNSSDLRRRKPLKLLVNWIALVAFFGLVGCSKSGGDLNKSLKPVDPNMGKPQTVKDAAKDDRIAPIK